jgi:hypothetical protein
MTGKFDAVPLDSALPLKATVDTRDSLPIANNTENDLIVVRDTDKLYTWSIAASSGSLSDWKEIGAETPFTTGIEIGTLDPQNRVQILNCAVGGDGAIFRSGNAVVEGDSQNIAGDGFVVYNQNIQNDTMSADNFSIGRLDNKQIYFRNAKSGIGDFNLFELDVKSNIYTLKDNAGNTTFDFTRSVGNLSISGDISLASSKGLKINEAIAGKALSFDGLSGYATITNKPALHPASGKITVDIKMFFKDTVPTSQQIIYIDGTVGQARVECTIESLAGGYGVLGFSDGAANYYGVTSLLWSANTLYTLRYTWDSTLSTNNLKVYRDNVLIETWSTSYSFPTHSSDAWIAALPGYGLYNRMVIDEIRISDNIRTDTIDTSAQLEADEHTVILLSMNEGSGISLTDGGPNNFTTTLSGGVTWIDGIVVGSEVDKNIISRTSGTIVTDPGTINIGYIGDKIVCNGDVEVSGEIKLKMIQSAVEPTLTNTQAMVIWNEVSSGVDRVYLIFKRGTADQVKVELC